MTELDLEAREQRPREKPAVPMVIEIMPGQASEGLIDTFEPGTYDGRSLRELCEQTLEKTRWSIEDQQIVDDIKRQLAGGKLLCRGKAAEGEVRDYATLEVTEAGEQYFYVPVRAIKPQEGG